MEYGIGRPGRVIVARLFEGEDVYACIEEIARKEDVRCGSVLVTGGIRRAEVVVGPKQEEPELVGDFRTFLGPGEVLGIGTLFWDDSDPKLHLHGALGRGDQTMVGCPRGGASTFLILEVMLIEVTELDARREADERTGLKLLRINPQ